MRDDLKSLFLAPKTSKQRQYEALRAYVIDEASASQVADRFGFTEKSLYALAHDLRTGKLNIFPKLTAKNSKELTAKRNRSPEKRR